MSAVMLGAAGGLIVELIVLFTSLTAWRQDRRQALLNQCRALPEIRRYVDPVPDSLVAITRVALGAVAGWVFHNQIIGTAAAVTVGASAPMILWQIGTIS